MIVNFPTILLSRQIVVYATLYTKVIISTRKQKTETAALILHSYVQPDTLFSIFI